MSDISAKIPCLSCKGLYYVSMTYLQRISFWRRHQKYESTRIIQLPYSGYALLPNGNERDVNATALLERWCSARCKESQNEADRYSVAISQRGVVVGHFSEGYPDCMCSHFFNARGTITKLSCFQFSNLRRYPKVFLHPK